MHSKTSAPAEKLLAKPEVLPRLHKNISGSRDSVALKSCGKACGETVDWMWDASVQKYPLFHSHTIYRVSLWKTDLLFRHSYTICMQLLDRLGVLLTSVNLKLYTVFTGPTNTTTIFK